jgi:hypothetical protein
MNKKYVVRLEDEERARLDALVSQGRAAARTIQRPGSCSKPTSGPPDPVGPTPRFIVLSPWNW